jgi:DNA modification methylase
VIGGAFRLASLAPSSPFYVSAPAGPRSAAFRAAIEAVGWRLHQELVWVKGTIVLGHSDYQYGHEPILYGYVPGAGRPGRGRRPGSHWYGDNGESSVLEYPKPAANRDHPTAKPVALVGHCLRNSTRPADLVYEPFAGSGTTLIAAEQLGRRCHAMELDPRYAQVTIERWQSFTGRDAVKIDD